MSKVLVILWVISAIVLIQSWITPEDWKLLIGFYLFVYVVIISKQVILISVLLARQVDDPVRGVWIPFAFSLAFWIVGLVSFYLQHGRDNLFYWCTFAPIVWAGIVVIFVKFGRTEIVTDGKQFFRVNKSAD